jgi:two-component system response regulator
MRVNPKVLLLVEDSRDDAELILSTLINFKPKAKIIHVKDGAEAMDYLFARSAKYAGRALPHCILLDLKIPKIPGLEVLKQIRTSEELAKIPVVVFTSSKEEPDILESYRLNASSYLQKPIDFDEFEETVKQLGIYWIALNHYPSSWENAGAFT